MKALVIATGIVAATGWMAIVGCNRTDATQDGTPAVTAAVEDDQLETYLRARFQMEDNIRAHDIDVTAADGRVTLRGRVPSEAERQQALQVARGVAGVQTVEDQLVVGATEPAPMTPSATAEPSASTARGAGDRRDPAWITTKIRAQYFVNPEIRPWRIDVSTNAGGVVTLSGQIDDAADREEAVRIARATEGVTDVEDRLTTERRDAAGVQEPDAWITAKIQAQYFLDAEVKGRDIDVDTQNGVVTVRGTVDNEAERRQALMIARNTEGVRDVTDQLTVTGTARPTDSRTDLSRAAAAIDDAWITTKIQSKYFLDPDIKGSAIDVTTSRGVVTLQGAVPSAEQQKSAEQIATETDGVRRVNNQLTVATTNR